ncbi:MAG: NINE protein [Candidatus Scatovivens sp.]
MEEKSNKSWLTTLILCWFLGFLGIHRIYAGKLGSGFLMMYGTICASLILFVNAICGMLAFLVVGSFVVNDFLLISVKHFKDCRGAYITEDNFTK